MRELSASDHVIAHLDQALRTLFGQPRAERANPAHAVAETPLEESSRREAGRLMRVNHAGEVCAQALYQGQSLTARHTEVRTKLEQAAREENDHLAWTAQRIAELGTHTSYLNPLWYAGSLAIGAAAGLAGDRWNLGFLAETEKQVVEHLTGHLRRLPDGDDKSRAILEQMRADEGRHATTALEAGAAPLPRAVRRLMRLASRVMTSVSYWV